VYGGAGTYFSSHSTNVPFIVAAVSSAGFSAATNFGADFNPYTIASGDFNGDLIPDLAVANYATNDVSVLLGNGNGTFQTAVNYPRRFQW
jgi:hypothetical protein